MDSATRELMLLRRDRLISEVRRLDRDKNDRIREVTSSPTFDPFTHSIDAGVARLIDQQNAVISELQEIDRRLSAS